MLDTIKLILDKDMFVIKDISLFQKEKQNASRGYFTLVQNPTKEEMKNGIYKPRLTMTKRFNCSKRFEATLAVELSLPKLMFGNNFDELTQDDFGPVTEKLQKALRSMGVMVFTKLLETAPVSAIHYSKNIPLTDGSTPHYLISKIKEANIKLSLDVNQTDYRNDGSSYKWHANSYEISFYDKIKDLQQAKTSKSRAIERDNILQLNLFEQLSRRRAFEVLRMEVRLNKRQKIGQLFRTLGVQSELTYSDLFSSSISQKVLLHYLTEIESKRPALLDYNPPTQKTLLAELIFGNPKLGLKQTIFFFGLKQAFNVITPRDLRAMFGKYNQRSWYRLIAKAKNVKIPVTTSPFEVVRKHLTSFEPLKLVDFQEQMLNNDKYN